MACSGGVRCAGHAGEEPRHVPRWRPQPVEREPVSSSSSPTSVILRYYHILQCILGYFALNFFFFLCISNTYSYHLIQCTACKSVYFGIFQVISAYYPISLCTVVYFRVYSMYLHVFEVCCAPAGWTLCTTCLSTCVAAAGGTRWRPASNTAGPPSAPSSRWANQWAHWLMHCSRTGTVQVLHVLHKYCMYCTNTACTAQILCVLHKYCLYSLNTACTAKILFVLFKYCMYCTNTVCTL